MKINNICMQTLLGLVMVTVCSCERFLDVKPDTRLTVPSKLEDLQSLLDNHSALSTECNAGEISSDDFVVDDVDLASLSSEWHRRTYTWEKDYLFEDQSSDWRMFGTALYYANFVLEYIGKMERTDRNQAEYDNIKGSALLIRARRLFQASLVWNLVYNEQSASVDLGMPLRTGSDFNETSVRSTIAETYQFIIADLQSAAMLLPDLADHPLRPSKAAAYGLLARVYLYMGRYAEAGDAAASCLEIKDTLLDYNELNAGLTYPFPKYNEETILYFGMSVGQILNLTRAKIVPEVYELFADNDVRKDLFFTTNDDGSHGFRGRYTGGAALFAGIATDEMFLIRAECHARNGETEKALNDLNRLVSHRYKKENDRSLYIPVISDNPEEVLQLVLNERRKQLIFRGLRWYDIKRFNRDGANIVLARSVNGKEYTLPPNDLRYALPLPEDVIALSGMEQNPR